jgi:carbonic anhydrase
MSPPSLFRSIRSQSPSGDRAVLKIFPASTQQHLDQVRTLMLSYVAYLRSHQLEPKRLEKEMGELPGVYGPPEGLLLMATWSDETVACGGIRRLEEGVCEIKRLYLRPAYRGKGIGRALAGSLIEGARSLGYRKIVLVTLPFMREAVSLYRSLGFRDCGAFRETGAEGALFMELDLGGPAAS